MVSILLFLSFRLHNYFWSVPTSQFENLLQLLARIFALKVEQSPFALHFIEWHYTVGLAILPILLVSMERPAQSAFIFHYDRNVGLLGLFLQDVTAQEIVWNRNAVLYKQTQKREVHRPAAALWVSESRFPDGGLLEGFSGDSFQYTDCFVLPCVEFSIVYPLFRSQLGRKLERIHLFMDRCMQSLASDPQNLNLQRGACDFWNIEVKRHLNISIWN